MRRWTLPEDPRGIALGSDKTVYIGLAQPQAVIAVDAQSGAVKKRVVLDSADIASTKELVTLRTNRDRTRLYIANGSDESASILSLPDLTVLREITMEGETIRDVLPDPNGHYLYLLGRRVHVFDAAGEHEIHTISIDEPMAIATTSNGSVFAVIGSEMFGTNKATVVALYDTKNFAEVAREPLQTADVIESALFADRDRALVAASNQHLFEKHLDTKSKPMSSANGQMRMIIDFGDLVSSDRICLPEGSGPQIITAGSGDLVLFAERRCNSSGAFTGA
ncbi:MAG: YncE family protein, partial [Thermoanaerobaculia bacterium]